MNTIPLETARAIAQSFADAVANNQKSEQEFVDVYKATTYKKTIQRTCRMYYDKLNRHDISRFEIIERSCTDIITRVVLDDVESIEIEDDRLLTVRAGPYVLSIIITGLE